MPFCLASPLAVCSPPVLDCDCDCDCVTVAPDESRERPLRNTVAATTGFYFPSSDHHCCLFYSIFFFSTYYLVLFSDLRCRVGVGRCLTCFLFLVSCRRLSVAFASPSCRYPIPFSPALLSCRIVASITSCCISYVLFFVESQYPHLLFSLSLSVCSRANCRFIFIVNQYAFGNYVL